MTERAKGAYAAAGVDIDEQEAALAGIRELVASTATPGVLGELGGFGGLFRPDLEGLEEPVLVASADGVGTKLQVARMAGDFSSVGRDLVNHCTNDILAQGARPLFFLDYVGAGVLEAEAMRQLVSGVADGCRENGCALLGGETAEMPGFYQPGDYELVGFIVGLADRARLLDGSRVEAGDVLVGLPSNGLHTNGYTLARHAFFERAGHDIGDRWREGGTVGELLLRPHRTYLPALEPVLGEPWLHGLAHITGGGLTDNLPRVLPDGLEAHVRLSAWRPPVVFGAIAEWAAVAPAEMLRVFNMGIGMVVIVPESRAGEVAAAAVASGLEGATVIGGVESGERGVVYDGLSDAAS